MEFCMYIHKGRLMAVSQKDASLFYPFLLEKKDYFSVLLQEFVEKVVRDCFPVETCKYGWFEVVEIRFGMEDDN